MTAIADLDVLLRSLDPAPRAGEYVFVGVPEGESVRVPIEASVREDEGLSLVVTRQVADLAGWAYSFTAAWITLRVTSDLSAVGLTAAVAGALASEGISCNVIAGVFHDHLLVPVDRRDEAMAVLRRVGDQARRNAPGSIDALGGLRDRRGPGEP